MYRLQDIENLIDENYELTELDRKIYEKFGWVIGLVDKYEIVYREMLGGQSSQKLIFLDKKGNLFAKTQKINSDGTRDYDLVDLTLAELDLMNLKLKEFRKGVNNYE